MKKIILSLSVISVLFSCKNNPEENVDYRTEKNYGKIAAMKSDYHVGNAETAEASDIQTDDVDKMLKDYEIYVNQYIIMYKKAMNGDKLALAEYPAIMDKVHKLEISMKMAEDTEKITVQQVKKMNDINMKMMQAMHDSGWIN